VDFLLSARHDPILIGLGKPGMDTTIENVDNVSTVTSDTCASTRRKTTSKNNVVGSTEGLDNIMKNVIELCKTNCDESVNNKRKNTTNSE